MSQTIPITNIEKQSKSLTTKYDTVQMTFYITYVLLLTTGTITLVEAIATNNSVIRHIMNLETCISLIAGYFYSQFINKMNTDRGNINYKEINEMRYTDWFITTPIMILVIMLSLGYMNNQKVHLLIYITTALLNFGMLFSGYLGEINTISKSTATIIGFIFFTAMFSIIYISFVHGSKSLFNYTLFGLYFIIWSIYGIVYLFDEENKNIIFNILDLISKCIIGIGLWAYFTKTIVL